jgi:hypothetical protein
VAKQGNTGEKWRLNFADEHLSCSQCSFTCRKSTTRDRRLYFSSEGRRATDFITLKIHRPRPGLNPRSYRLFNIENDDEMGGSCRANGEMKMLKHFWLDILKGRDYWEDIGLD